MADPPVTFSNASIASARFVAVLLAASALQPAQAESGEPYRGDIKTVFHRTVIDLTADATFVETVEQELEVLTDRGIGTANHGSIAYSESLQRPEILAAYTIKRSGERIDVPPAQIQERGVVAGGGPMFSDIKAKELIFPGVEVGDRVGLSYRMTHVEPMFPGKFSYSQVYSRTALADDVSVRITAPDSLKLKSATAQLEEPEITSADGRMAWTWRYRNDVIEELDQGGVDIEYTMSRFLISSFEGFGDLAEAYESRARPRSAATPEIRKLAMELSGKLKDKRAIVQALSAWVARNIRYAGNCIGIGSVVPHPADLVLQNRLGDCKDHTALLQALLTARGINSTPVLINTRGSYRLPEVPLASYFNHVITYVPDLDLYVDSGADFYPLRTLPFEQAGKPVLHTANFDGVRHTPPVRQLDLYSRMTKKVRINEDGSSDGEIVNEDTAYASVRARAWAANLDPQAEQNFVRDAFSRMGRTGSGTLIHDDPRSSKATHRYGLKYHLENAIPMPGPGSFPADALMQPSVSLALWAAGASAKPRSTNVVCGGGHSIEEHVIELPDNIRVLALPRDVELRTESLTYVATYRQEGQRITVRRELQDPGDSHLCTPADIERERPAALAIQKDISARILYE